MAVKLALAAEPAIPRPAGALCALLLGVEAALLCMRQKDFAPMSNACSACRMLKAAPAVA